MRRLLTGLARGARHRARRSAQGDGHRPPRHRHEPHLSRLLTPRSARWRPRRVSAATASAIAVAAATALVVFGRSLRAWFTGDDFEIILDATRRLPRGSPYRHPRNHLRPVTDLVTRVDHAIAGLSPTPYHLTNVGLHALDAVLVGWVATLLAARTGHARDLARRLGFLAGGLFLVMPTHTEAVSWIGGRGDLLAATGCLVAVGAYLRAAERGSRWWWSVALAAAAVGLLAKEAAVVLPLVIVAIAAATARSSGEDPRAVVRRAVATWPFVAVLAADVIVRWAVLGRLVGSYSGDGAFDWRPSAVVRSAAALVARSFVPGISDRLDLVLVVAACVALALLARGAFAATSRPARRAAVALATCSGACVVLAIVPAVGLGVSGRDTQGERLTYLASAFAAIAIATILVHALDRVAPDGLRAAAAATVVVLLVGGAIWTASLDARWAHAGRLSAALTVDAPWRGTADRVVVVITPDDVAGAYVDRNALGAGTVLLEGGTGARVTNMVPARYADALDRVAVTRVGRRTWRLRLTDPAAAVLDGSDGLPWFPVPGIAVRRVDRRTVSVRLEPTVDPSDVWYVSRGSAHHLDG